ncbi:MAG TPA: hypothetical protein VH561_13060 [Micromonosporaceae bacterium]
MHQAFVHTATLIMGADADLGAPGAAVTVALCGHWEHEPPCPLAAHHTRATRVEGEVRLRILFAAEPTAEQTVRERIDAALAAGELRGPDGSVTRWRWQSSQRDEVADAERAHGRRLVRG